MNALNDLNLPPDLRARIAAIVRPLVGPIEIAIRHGHWLDGIEHRLDAAIAQALGGHDGLVVEEESPPAPQPDAPQPDAPRPRAAPHRTATIHTHEIASPRNACAPSLCVSVKHILQKGICASNRTRNLDRFSGEIFTGMKKLRRL